MDFYLFETRRGSSVLYTEGERIDPTTHEELKPDYSNPVDRFLEKLSQRKGRFSVFLRNLILLVRSSYYKLEDRIDPMERVFKSMRHAQGLNLCHSPQLDTMKASKRLSALLESQQKKHLFWGAVDFVFTIAAILFSPILIPLPGPNFFFYYPIARLFSHILARRGATHGTRITARTFTPVAEIQEIEFELNQQRDPLDFDKIGQAGLKLHLERLPLFLKKYV